MSQQAAATKMARDPARDLRLIPPEQILTRLNAFHEAVAARAFEIFNGRGRTDGHAIDDWFRAESELFHIAHLDMTEVNDGVMVRAEVPGFRANELHVCVEPRRMTITGKRQDGDRSRRTVMYSDHCPDRILRVVGFPCDVDNTRATAVLNDGILELSIPKALSRSRVWLLPKTDSLVRADDYRAWRGLVELPEPE